MILVRTVLTDRLSTAVGVDLLPDAYLANLVLIAEAAVVEWMRETARDGGYSDNITASVLLEYAHRIENGEA